MRRAPALLAVALLPLLAAAGRGDESRGPEALRADAEGAFIGARPPAAPPGATPLEPRAVDEEASTPARRAEGIGLSHSGDPFDIPDFTIGQVAQLLRRAGGTHYRPHLPLKEPHPELSAEDLARLDRASRDPALLDAMIDELARDGQWARMDSLVGAFTGQGIKLMLVVGAGYVKEAPTYAAADGSRRPVSPDRIGRDRYITMVRWLVGAAVRRYASRVVYWQAENEINIADLVMAIGWRAREPSWADVGFRQRLLAAISRTVHAEGRRRGLKLETAHNFAVGVPWQEFAGPAAEMTSAVETFGAPSDIDIVGLDLYDNHFTGWPILDKVMTRNVRTAVAAARGRPVWVIETGFATAPRERGFTEARQGKYFRRIFDDCYEAGAEVVLAFGWFWNPRGWFTNSPKPLPWYNVSAPEQYWSPVHVSYGPGGEKSVTFGPAWSAFEAAAKKWIATEESSQ